MAELWSGEVAWFSFAGGRLAVAYNRLAMMLSTPRLHIRPMTMGDADDLAMICRLVSETPLAKYDRSWPAAREEFLPVMEYLSAGQSNLALCLPDGAMIGMVRLNRNPKGWRRRYDFGYVVHPDQWNRGYATEAGRAVLREAFETLRACEVTSGSAVENVGSCRVLEKLGFEPVRDVSMSFRNDAEGKPISIAGRLFRLTRNRWRQLNPSARNSPR